MGSDGALPHSPTATIPRPGSPTHAKSLWFEDGNIVFQAGSTLYKVYRGMLCARSTVFQDMLSFPQPEHIERYDGYPLILLYDHPKDVDAFFDALFNTTAPFWRVQEKAHFEIVTSVLRLSNKYDVQHLRRRAIQYLDDWFPKTLQEFDQYHRKTLAGQELDNFMALSAADICNVQWILPVALYRCATFPLSTIIERTKDDDAVLVARGFQASVFREQLLMAHSKLADAERTDIWAPIQEYCHYEDMECNASKLACISSLLKQSQPLSLDVFEHWESHATMTVMKPQRICERCYLSGKEDIMRHRQELWDRIPTIFGLGQKEDLDVARSNDLTDDNDF